MSREAGGRREWTHRRLGLGATKPGDAQLAHTEALLTAVGARDSKSAAVTGDPFATALLDFAYDVDLTAGIGSLDSRLIPNELLRLNLSAVKPRRLSWHVLVPTMGTALAAIVVVATVLIGRGDPVIVSPAATATTESHQLLRHADALIADATKAAPAARKRLVSEARADLVHVTHLLPLAPPEQRPAIRRQLLSLEQQVAPPPPTRPATNSGNSGRTGTTNGNGGQQLGSGGSGSGVGSGSSGSSPGGGVSSGTPTGTGAPTTVVPTPLPTEGGQRPFPPPVSSGQGGQGTTGSTGEPQGAAPTAPAARPLPPEGGDIDGGDRQGPPPGSGRQGPPPPGGGLSS